VGKLLQPSDLWDVRPQPSQPHQEGAGRESLAWPKGAVKRQEVKTSYPCSAGGVHCTSRQAGDDRSDGESCPMSTWDWKCHSSWRILYSSPNLPAPGFGEGGHES